MKYKMNLWPDAFEAIKLGHKTIEVRLNDEKRSAMTAGDAILFTNTKTGETLFCHVINTFRYSSFDELYRQHDKISIGYKENEVADPKDMLLYYTQEDIKKYGVLGIEVKVS